MREKVEQPPSGTPPNQSWLELQFCDELPQPCTLLLAASLFFIPEYQRGSANENYTPRRQQE